MAGLLELFSLQAIIVLRDNVVRCGPIGWLEERLDIVDDMLARVHAEQAPD